jgi:hydrogenase/urease accessory protein HupE
MRSRVATIALLCAAGVIGTVTPAFAHRIDEYLQAATISITPERVTVRVRLTAGVAVASKIIAAIDTDGDGTFSTAEQQRYAATVQRDVSLGVNGHALPLTTDSSSFPSEREMRDGLGDIVLSFHAQPASGEPLRYLTFQNHHQRPIAVYLVNTLVPTDSAIHIAGQDRARDQSAYRLDFSPDAIAVGTNGELLARGDHRALVTTYFWHGVHHILSGFDHLLFLAALVLGAATLWDLVKVVTAFTFAHSITLTLAALGWVHLPSGVVEPLIAASIVFVALQNVFWPDQSHGRSRLLVAFSFGLFHGLGFAGGLLEIMHRMPTAMILLAIVGFSLGVEAGNQLVLLPLFGFLRLVRRVRANNSGWRRPAAMLPRIGSAAVSLAGLYYLCIALVSA